MYRNYQADKALNKTIRHIFLDAHLQEKWSFFLAYGMRVPSYIIQNTLIPFAVALGLQAIFDRQFDSVGLHVLWVLGLAIASGVLSAIGTWSICHNAKEGCAYVQRQVFANYLSKDYEFYSNSFYGALGAQAARLRDCTHEYGRIITIEIPQQVCTVVVGLIVIGYTAPLLAIVTLICMLFVLSFTILTSKWRLKYRRQLSEASSELAGALGDALTHSSTVKSFAAEHYEQQQLEPSINHWQRAQFIVWISSIPSDFGRNFLAACTIGILLVLTAYFYQQGAISVAIVVLVQFYVLKMITVTQDIAETIKLYENIMGSAFQAVKTMQIAPAIQDPEQPKKLPKKLPEHIITFEAVSYRYNQAHPNLAVADFSLTVKRGEKIGLVGYSGSGKTTLTKLLLRFIDVDQGAIRIGKLDVRDLSQKDLRQLIAYVPQEPLLFHRSIADNIAYGRPSASRREVLKAARMAHVGEFVDQLPSGYDTLVGERGIKLSGGQRQRVAIARAILKDAPILVLDEATSALDSKSEQLIQEGLAALMQDRTALVIAHRLSTIQRMDRIVVMDRGRIVQNGTHKQLLADKDGIYAQLWEHQSGGYILGSATTVE